MNSPTTEEQTSMTESNKSPSNFFSNLFSYFTIKYGLMNVIYFIVLILIIIYINPLFIFIESIEFEKQFFKSIQGIFKGYRKQVISGILLFIILSIINKNHFKQLDKDQSSYLLKEDYFNHDHYSNSIASYSCNMLLYILNILITFFSFLLSLSLWKYIIKIHNPLNFFLIVKTLNPLFNENQMLLILKVILNIILIIPTIIVCLCICLKYIVTLGNDNYILKSLDDIVSCLSMTFVEKIFSSDIYKFYIVVLCFLAFIAVIFGLTTYFYRKKEADLEKQDAEMLKKLQICNLFLMVPITCFVFIMLFGFHLGIAFIIFLVLIDGLIIAVNAMKMFPQRERFSISKHLPFHSFI